MNKSIVSEIESLNQLITWLHRDIDLSIEDAEPEVKENYSSMFKILEHQRNKLSSLL